MAIVRKKKNGVEHGNYYLVIYIGGKQKWISTGTDDKCEAAEFYSRYRQGNIPADRFDATGMTIVDYARHCLGEDTASVRPSTSVNNDYAVACLQKYCDTAYGCPVMLISADEDFCVRYFIWLSENYSFTTAASRFGFLKTILAKAALRGDIPFNPCEKLKQKTVTVSVNSPNRSATALDARRAGEFLGFCRAHMSNKIWPFWYAYYAWATAVYTGMKRGELLALTVSDVDMINRILHIRHNITLSEGIRYDGEPKADSGVRDLYINTSLDIILNDLITRLNPKEFNRISLLHKNNPRRYLFCTENYSPISPHCLSMCVEEAADAWASDGGGCTLRLHDARHTCASILYNDEKLPLDTVSAFLGHKNTKTTEIYLNKLAKAAVSKRIITATANLASAIGTSARKSFAGQQRSINNLNGKNKSDY
ncbi:MAG: tyrosine-type recombinase/integrase [Eubacteriales bacterium]|nr:tyrosine-type recombinase/integrase [Eubacteriales bacterium]